MKMTRWGNVRSVIGALAIVAGLVLSACGGQSPFEPQQTEKAGQLKFLEVFPSHAALLKGDHADNTNTDSGWTDSSKVVSARITPRDGGFLFFRFRGDRFPEHPEWAGKRARVTLEVLPHAVSSRETISLELTPETMLGSVNMRYAPHGLVFRKDAILNVVAEGLQLSDIPAEQRDNVGFYYVNQETGIWEPMASDDLIIDFDAGTLKLVNGKLPHFSRYAIAQSQ